MEGYSNLYFQMNNYKIEFKINESNNLETDSYLLNGVNGDNDNNINFILNKLRDNDIGEVEPKDIRDSIFSLWTNSVFKETNNGDVGYIGIDTLNGENRDIKLKILLGKSFYSKFDRVLDNSDLLDDDTDILFYNTKSENESQNETKISILVGIDEDLNKKAPYLSSLKVEDTSLLSLNIINDGEIKIKSRDDSGVSVNNIIFPTINESESRDIDGKILIKDSDNKLKWSNIDVNLGNEIGNESEPTIIKGDLDVNGYPLEFSDDRKVPIDLGGLSNGDTFDKYPISELIKKVSYTYQPPSVGLSFLSPYDKGFVEIGSTPDVKIEYRISKKNKNTNATILKNMIPNFHPPIMSSNFKNIIEVASAQIIPYPVRKGIQEFEITASDEDTSVSEKIDLEGIHPIYYGISNDNVSNLSKLIDKPTNEIPFVKVSLSGNGKLVFMYPKSYGKLASIVGNSGNIVGDFDKTLEVISSDEGNWVDVEYWVYESNSSFVSYSPVEYKIMFENNI